MPKGKKAASLRIIKKKTNMTQRKRPRISKPKKLEAEERYIGRKSRECD